jgi:hypothetical protein
MRERGRMKTTPLAAAATGLSAVCLMGALAGCGGSSNKATAGITTPTTASPTSGPLATSTSTTTTGAPPTSVPPSTSSIPATTVSHTTVAPIDTAIEVYGNCATPSVEPSEIVETCADYGTIFDGLRWTSWTSTSATAVGTGVYSHCSPYCPKGTLQVADTKITLTVPVRTTRGQLLWSEIQENPEPPGYETGPYHGGPQPLPTRPD